MRKVGSVLDYVIFQKSRVEAYEKEITITALNYKMVIQLQDDNWS